MITVVIRIVIIESYINPHNNFVKFVGNVVLSHIILYAKKVRQGEEKEPGYPRPEDGKW